MSEIIGKHYLDLDIHQNNYISFTCKQDNSAEYIYATIYDNGEHINNLTTLLTSLDVKLETPDNRHLKLSSSDVWQRCKKDDVGAILITSSNISTYSPYISDIAVGEYVRKGTSELIIITNDIVEIHLPQSVFLESGKCKGEIILIHNENQLATMDFLINIIKSVYTDKEIIDDAYSESEVTQLKNYMSEYVKRAENSANNAATSEKNASNYASTASEKAIESSNYAESASNSLISIEIKSAEIKQIENDITQMKSDVSIMKSDVTTMQVQVAKDKTDIETTIQESLLSKSEEILNTVKDYFNRAQQLYDSMYIDCDGETPQMRATTLVTIDCGTPQTRVHDDNGIVFDGGTPLGRFLGK